jgi:hypothetical protein
MLEILKEGVSKAKDKFLYRSPLSEAAKASLNANISHIVSEKSCIFPMVHLLEFCCVVLCHQLLNSRATQQDIKGKQIFNFVHLVGLGVLNVG